jgi:uncharacterized membrane protein
MNRKMSVFLIAFLFCSLVPFGLLSSHFTATSIGFAKAPIQGETVLFDESHSPFYQFLITEKYNNFSVDLQGQGYTVEAMSTWNPVRIMEVDIIVIPVSADPYTSAELNILHEFVAKGGGLFIICDGGGTGTADDVAAYFYAPLHGGGLAESDDQIAGNPTWIDWHKSSQFGDHPITSGVSNVETYYGDGLDYFPLGATPILISDVNDHSYWWGTSNDAFGVAAMVAFEYQYGLGRIVVTGDGNQFDDRDADSDATIDYFDEDNEILARNVIYWLAHPTVPDTTIVFDESNSPLNSIAAIPETIDVLFDETHSPWASIDPNTNTIYGYEDDSSVMGDFAQSLEGAGFAISRMTSWSSLTLGSADIVVFVNPSAAYSPTQLDDILDYVRDGGSVLVLGENNVHLGAATRQVARLFDCDFYEGALNDSDDNYGLTGWLETDFKLDGANLGTHQAMNGISELGIFYGTALNATPSGATTLFRTDDDTTIGWYTTPPGSPSARNLPIASAFAYGRGRVCVTGDMTMFYNTTTDPLLTYGQNCLFGINIVRWLGEMGYNIGNYYDAAQQLRLEGYGVLGMRVFDEFFFADADALALSVPSITYSLAERNAIQSYVETQGHGLLIIGDWATYGDEANYINQAFGFDLATGGSVGLLDTDDTLGITLQFFLQANNFGTHSILNGISELIWLAGSGFDHIPNGADTLLYMDDDANSSWNHNASSAALVAMMCSLETNRGRVASIGDGGLWGHYVPESSTIPDNHTMALYHSDNRQLLVNTIEWLTANRAPIVTVTDPNGGETIAGLYNITWTADDYDDDSLTFDLYYSVDNGSTWNSITTGVTNLWYEWDTILLPMGSLYRIRVIGNDGLLTGEDLSDGSFTVSNPAPPIPGFPLEAIIIGLAVCLGLIVVVRRRRTVSS